MTLKQMMEYEWESKKGCKNPLEPAQWRESITFINNFKERIILCVNDSWKWYYCK